MLAAAEEAVSIAVDDGDVFSLSAFVRWVVVVRLDRLTRGDYDRAFADLRQRGSGIRVHLRFFPEVRPRVIGKASPRTMMRRLQNVVLQPLGVQPAVLFPEPIPDG